MVEINKMTNDDQKALAIMAHDLKAPLSAVIDLLDVINKGYVEDVVKIKELVDRATQKAETLIVMLDDILDYTLLANKT
jgi:signal transduction histidine kinase